MQGSSRIKQRWLLQQSKIVLWLYSDCAPLRRLALIPGVHHFAGYGGRRREGRGQRLAVGGAYDTAIITSHVVEITFKKLITVRDFCLIRILGRIQHADTAANGYTWPRLPSASGRAPPAADPRNRRSGVLPLQCLLQTWLHTAKA